MQLSPILEKLVSCTPAQRMRALRAMTPQQRLKIMHSWEVWGRPSQQWEPIQRMTFVTSGRGWGKTRFASEQTHRMAYDYVEVCGGQIGIAGRTYSDVERDLIKGPSGILATQKPWNQCRVYKDAVEWSNGVVGYILTGDVPEKFRGLNLGFLLCDEFAHWQYPQECYEAFEYCVRHGTFPSIIITSTPLPIKIVKEIWNDPKTRRMGGHTRENALNINSDALQNWIEKYENTKLGDQEMGGIILENNENAVFRQEWFQRCEMESVPGLVRTVVSVDPAGGSRKKNNETGIVVCARDNANKGYVLGDYSGKYRPEGEDGWAAKAIAAALCHGADAIIGERNFGGDMVMATIRQHQHWSAARDQGVELIDVEAVSSKGDRAVPVGLLYEQRRIYHVGNPRQYDKLEHQMTNFDPILPRDKQDSPDRMDGLVHGFREIFPSEEKPASSGRTSMDVAKWREMLDSLGGLQ